MTLTGRGRPRPGRAARTRHKSLSRRRRVLGPHRHDRLAGVHIEPWRRRQARLAGTFCPLIAAPEREIRQDWRRYSGHEHVEVGAVGEASAPCPYNHTECDHRHREPQLPEPPHAPRVPPQTELPQNHAHNDTSRLRTRRAEARAASGRGLGAELGDDAVRESDGAGDRKQCDQQIDGTHGAGSGSLRLGGARWHVAGTFLEGEGRVQHRFTRSIGASSS